MRDGREDEIWTDSVWMNNTMERTSGFLYFLTQSLSPTREKTNNINGTNHDTGV